MINYEGGAPDSFPNKSVPSGSPHGQSSPLFNPEINVPRLLADLGVTRADLHVIDTLRLSEDIGVASLSQIKITTVADSMHIAQPTRHFRVKGESGIASGVNEQPVGQQTIDGSFNRLQHLVVKREAATPGSANTRSDVSIENGLFRIGAPTGLARVAAQHIPGVLQFIEGVNLDPNFDPDAEYEDRAVVAIRIPGQPIIIQISPLPEAVPFPHEAVLAAAQAAGGLAQNTASSILANMGLVVDKQNPHVELTADRPGGALPRQDQMARVILRALVRLAHGDNPD